MRNVSDSSARKRLKLTRRTKVRSTTITSAKMLTLLQTKVEEQEQKEQTVKNASEILEKFRTSVKDANILTSDMCEEDILLVVSATFCQFPQSASQTIKSYSTTFPWIRRKD